MIEVYTQCNALAQHVVCSGFDGKCACSGCGLRVILIDTTNERNGVAPREITIDGEVVVYAGLLAANFQYLIEVGYLIAYTHSDVSGSCFNNLACR